MTIPSLDDFFKADLVKVDPPFVLQQQVGQTYALPSVKRVNTPILQARAPVTAVPTSPAIHQTTSLSYGLPANSTFPNGFVPSQGIHNYIQFSNPGAMSLSAT